MEEGILNAGKLQSTRATKSQSEERILMYQKAVSHKL